MNSVEERLREALRVHAEEFTAHPDAWRQLTSRRRRRGGPPWCWLRSAGPTLVPLAAAVAVVAAVAMAILLVNGVSGRDGLVPAGGSTPRPVPSPAGLPQGMDQLMFTADPPLSAVVSVRVPWIGKKAGGRPERVTSYFWLARNNPASWPDQVNPGLQLCNATFNDSAGGAGMCWPQSAAGPPHLASVTGGQGVQTDQTIMVGEAVARVRSVTAVLADGRTYPGAVTTGRGLPGVVWAVGYPWTAGFPYTRGAHLVFRDAAGKQVTVLDPHAPAGPPRTAQPASGGVTLFSYPAGHGQPAGTVQAYLIHGEVGFWSRIWGGAISQRLAAGPPVLGGLIQPFGVGGDGSATPAVALGYAHADVARVVLRAGGRQLASAATAAAGWPGSSLRLWHVRLPLTMEQLGTHRAVTTATAYDAAGHVLGQVQLGRMS